MPDISVHFHELVSTLNEADCDLTVFRKYWTTMPAGVKTAIKNATVAVIDQAIVDLAAVKAEILSL